MSFLFFAGRNSAFFVVSVDRPDATEIETRRASTVQACNDIGALQLPAARSPIIKILPDTTNPLDSVYFSTHWLPTLARHCRTCYSGCCCTFFVSALWSAWIFTKHRNYLVPSARLVFFFVLLSVVFLLTAMSSFSLASSLRCCIQPCLSVF